MSKLFDFKEKSSGVGKPRFEKIATSALMGVAIGGLLGGCDMLAGKNQVDGIKRENSRPNIILLLTDDQRWDALGCMGNTNIHTPALDGLASKGVIFANTFVNSSICMASRASILTGQYAGCHQIDTFEKSLSPQQFDSSYPALLRQVGYRTGFVGKYGIGETLPEKKFDFFAGFTGQGKYFDGDSKHLTQRIADKSIEFLKGCSTDEQFCLSVSFKAPHLQHQGNVPFLFDPTYSQLYTDLNIPPPATMNPEYFDRLPVHIRKSSAREHWLENFSTDKKFQESVKGYYRLITGVDAAVARIIEQLEKTSLSDNTVIIFTSDNGYMVGDHELTQKWFMYEESIRVPLLVYDPRVDDTLMGNKIDEMTLNVDIAPTILDLAGLNISPTMQGKSFLPLIYGEKFSWREDIFYEYLFDHPKIPKSIGIRTKKWKYINYFELSCEELFDLENDSSEINDLSQNSKYFSTLQELRSRCIELQKEIAAK